MKQKILIFNLLLILASCSEKSNKYKTQFHAFIKQLKPIETPLIFNSREEYKLELHYYKDNLFFNHIQNELNGFGAFGLLFETNSFIAILGNIPTDAGTPIIITFDKNGTKIDSHLVYENVIGDMGIYTDNFESISSNMNLVFIDSTITRKINFDGTDEIPGSDSLSVKIKKYEISKAGRFIRTE